MVNETDLDANPGLVPDPEDDPHTRVRAWGSVELTMLFPPFGGPGASGDGVRAAHDPVRARQVVESLGTVEEVLEQLPDRAWEELSAPEVRADLDYVAVGCWGNVTRIIDPALASDLLANCMTREMARQRARHPQARIVGSVDLSYGNAYLEDEVALPGVENVRVFGWDCDEDDDWEVYGDPEEVLRVLGVDRAAAAEAGFDLDDEVSERDWPALGRFALEGFGPRLGQLVSVFRVRHTSGAIFERDEVWIDR
ncbi:DUF6333 family protein [Streptomyces sp. NPDC101150]|uniref:DUF6333 family protein n=1 Tax=Streptomyces sp. NPDC101150 TaxID=3366114 RepID=UPI0037FD85C7